MTMMFSILRIVGNSLPPRHSPENNFVTLEFVISNEPRFEDSERIWILNRIADPREKSRIIALLEKNGEPFVDIPFDPAAHFASFLDSTGLPEDARKRLAIDDAQDHPLLQEWVIRHKSQSLVGINSARNEALRRGRQRSTWTLVLDGCVIFTRSRWMAFRDALSASAGAMFAVIPMQRIYSWADARSILAREDAQGAGGAHPVDLHGEEPQLAFHRDSVEIFDERLRYGNRNKAELISRLGVPGRWNEWTPAAWDVTVPLPAPNKGRFVMAGSVLRLPATEPGKDLPKERHENRYRGLVKRSLELDLQYALSRWQPSRAFSLPGPATLREEDTARLRSFANDLLAERDRFITGKSFTAPSGALHDYTSVAPYTTPDGIFVDGVLQHQGSDDDPASPRYDRKSLARFAWRTFGLAVSGKLLERVDFLDKAADLARRWFIEESTRMNPSARYAQRTPGQPGVNDVGLIEFRHLALLPYALRILEGGGRLSPADMARITAWFAAFLKDCETSGALGTSLQRANNLGTWAAVLFASLALFTGEFGNGFYLARTASLRIGKQLALFSSQPLECARTRPLHYSLFNLSGWSMMSRVAAEFGIALESFRGVRGESLLEAVAFCADNRRRYADYAGNEAQFDEWIRLLLLMFGGRQTGEIAIAETPDLGLPPVILL